MEKEKEGRFGVADEKAIKAQRKHEKESSLEGERATLEKGRMMDELHNEIPQVKSIKDVKDIDIYLEEAVPEEEEAESIPEAEDPETEEEDPSYMNPESPVAREAEEEPSEEMGEKAKKIAEIEAMLKELKEE